LHAHTVVPQGVPEHGQFPFEQALPPQETPQPPQLREFVSVFTHVPLHSSYGAGPHTHDPPEHVVPVPQVPQVTVFPHVVVAVPQVALPQAAMPLSVHPQPFAPAPPPPQVFGGIHVLGQLTG
jgi:hypothetical protein